MSGTLHIFEQPRKLVPDLAKRLRDLADKVDQNTVTGLAIVFETQDVTRFIYDEGASHESLTLAVMLQHHLLKTIFTDGGDT